MDADGASAGCARERVAGFCSWDIGAVALPAVRSRCGTDATPASRSAAVTGARTAATAAALTAALGLAAASWVVAVRQTSGMDMGVATEGSPYVPLALASSDSES